MNRIERMEAVCNVKKDEVNRLLREVKKLVPRIKELTDTFYAAQKNGLNVKNYEYTDGYWSMAVYSKETLQMTRGKRTGISYESFFIDSTGDVYDSSYASKYVNNIKVFSDTFKVGPYKNDGELNDELIHDLKTMLDKFNVFEEKFYADIDAQLEKLEKSQA